MIKDLVTRNRNNEMIGLPSFCTSNDFVINALFSFAKENNVPVLIEATCNQVNQFGGYSGMKPKDFAEKITHKSQHYGVAMERIILGGDHLGPNPWKTENADTAMAQAQVLVKDFVEAGFTKIHLDASMACGDEEHLSFEKVAERSAQLCEVAEKYAPDPEKLSYVIGTEVPIPGGETGDMSHIAVTTPQRLNETIQTHQDAFARKGLNYALERAVAVVVQPGVDFSNDDIIHYDSSKAEMLTKTLGNHSQFAFEAHSSDYQSTENLKLLVADHSAILKVGPELTFKFREAVVILDAMEKALGVQSPSNIIEIVRSAMNDNSDNWTFYYEGTAEKIEFFKIYSFSDRIRYYWDNPSVQQALHTLFDNLQNINIPIPLITQYCNDISYDGKYTPYTIIEKKIQQSIRRYYSATGWL